MKFQVQSPKPNRVQNHVKQIKSLRLFIHNKMPLHLLHIPLQLQILSLRNPHQDLLNLWNLLHRHHDRELVPVQHITKRRHIAIGDQDRHTLRVDGLHHPRACHLVAARAEAELAALEHHLVGEVGGEFLIDLHVGIFSLPLV